MTQELTPELAISQFETHLIKAEVVPEINITELHALAEKAKALVDIDITDDAKMKEVAVVRKELVSARRKIQSDGKLARDEHTAVNKKIKHVEDFLVNILGDDEDRLKEFERQRKEKDIKEERLKTLPQRQLLLKGIGDAVVATDDEILSMDDATFLNYVTERQSTKMEADSYAEQARLAEEERKAGEANRIKKAEDRARIEVEAKVKTEQEARDRELEAKHQAEIKAQEAEIARIKQEQADKEAEDKRKQEAESQALQAIEDEKARLASQANYNQWLTNNNYNPATDEIHDSGIDVILYRKVAVYSKEI